jgi:cis-3-alkyl-4-acyloxetan-2-one decarboxylase
MTDGDKKSFTAMQKTSRIKLLHANIRANQLTIARFPVTMTYMSAANYPIVRVKHAHGFTQTGWDVEPKDVAYREHGRPETLVFVHGNPSSKWLFRHLIAAASPRYRCIAPDHIGMGDSDKPDRGSYDFHFEQRVDDLAAFLDARALASGALGTVTLIVHDWGGVIGLRYAQRFPERIARLVITNTAAFPLLAGKKLPKEIAFVRNTWLGGFLCKYANAFQRGAVWRGVMKRLSPEAANGYLSAHPTAHDCEAILRFVRDIPLTPAERGHDVLCALEAFLPTLAHLPIQLQWGLKDFVFDKDYLAAFQRLFPNAESHAYADAGHWLTEDAHERMTPLFLAFLERTAAIT